MANSKIIHSIWGNSIDKSVAAIVICRNDVGKLRAFFGSREQSSNYEEQDARYIADWGNELTVAKLKEIIEELENGG